MDGHRIVNKRLDAAARQSVAHAIATTEAHDEEVVGVLTTRGDVLEADPLIPAESSTVPRGEAPTLAHPPWDKRQLGAEDRGLQLVESAVVARHLADISPSFSMHPKPADSLREPRIVRHDGAA